MQITKVCGIIIVNLFVTGLASGQNTIDVHGRRIQLMKFEHNRAKVGIESDDSVPDYAHLAIQPVVDLTDLQSSVKNQGDRGSCAYFATAGLVESAFRSYYNKAVDFNMSEEYLIYYSKTVDGYSSGGDGSYVARNLKSVQNGGLLPEEGLPYSENWFGRGLPCERYADKKDSGAPAHCYAHYAPPADQLSSLIAPKNFKLTTTRLTGSMDEVLTQLNRGIPVTVALPLHYDGWNNDKEPVFYNEELDKACEDDKDDQCGGHAIVLVGYDLEKRTFRFKNSWGADWGYDGYGLMEFAYVERWAYTGEFWTAKFNKIDGGPYVNNPIDYSISGANYTIEPGINAAGEPGVWVNLSYKILGPVGTYYYVSVFGQSKAPDEAEFNHITYTDEAQKSQYVADRFYVVASNTTELEKTSDSPLKLFIPTAHLDSEIEAGKSVVLRASIYSMADTDAYKVMYRELIPYHVQSREIGQ